MDNITQELRDEFYLAIREEDVLQVSLYLRKYPELISYEYDEDPVLTAAVCESSLDILELLINAGADINQQNISDQTALHAAIIMGKDLEWIKLLLDNGADPNIKNATNDTPFTCSLYHQKTNFGLFLRLTDYLLENCLIDPRVGKVTSIYPDEEYTVMEYIETHLEMADNNGMDVLSTFFAKAHKILQGNLEKLNAVGK